MPYISVGISGSVFKKFIDPASAKIALYNALDKILPPLLKDRKDVEVELCSGESDEGGIDTWAHEYAIDRNNKFKPFPHDFKKYSRPDAYYVRNRELANHVHWLYGFIAPMEHSAYETRSGTMMTIRHGASHNTNVYVYKLIGTTFELQWKRETFLTAWTHVIEDDKL
jgi:hypothetical protein